MCMPCLLVESVVKGVEGVWLEVWFDGLEGVVSGVVI